MGGRTHIVTTRQGDWAFPVALLFRTVVLGIGIFEAAIFLVGTLLGSTDALSIVVGMLYFASPYNLLFLGWALPNSILRLQTWQRIAGVLILSLPFILYLWAKGSVQAGWFLAGLILLGIACNAVKVRGWSLPAVDVLGVTFFLTGPFIFGLMFAGSGGLLWLGGYLSGFMIVAANYLMYKLPLIDAERQRGYLGTAVQLGVEKTIAIILSLDIAAALLPIFAYGWYGVPAAVMLSWFIFVAVQALPFRALAGSSGLYRVWRINVWMGYVVTSALLVYMGVFLYMKHS